MTESLDDALARFDYTLPMDLIAQSPASPRDSAKLLVFNRQSKNVSFDIFRNIIDYLPPNCVLVFNQTKVFPARMRLTRETGGKISALYLEEHHGKIRTMAEGKLKPGDRLDWENGHFFIVEERDGKFAMLKPSFPIEELRPLLEKYGETPLPPYIKQSPLTEEQRRAEYQTVYANETGSVAAPTAGLHFTDELIKTIEKGGRHVRFVTLHVGLGTFAPVTERHWKEKKLHEEWYEINPATAHLLNEAKREHRPIIAVGTTTVRTLESAAQNGELTRLTGVTDIFITENDHPQFVDGLVTNFHVPRSSLMMLVSAFVGRERLLELYRQAIEKKFRFFSFGDGMLII